MSKNSLYLMIFKLTRFYRTSSTLSIRNMTVLKLEDIRIMEDIMIILSFITTPLNLFLLEERLKLIIIFGKRQGMKSV